MSKASKKPIFLFFTGVACEIPKMVNDLVLNDSEVAKEVNDSFVPVILNVDDGTKLLKERTILRDGIEITLRTKGNEWAYLEISKFGNNVQPLMVLIDENEEVIKSPIYGELNKEQIIEYLKL